MVYYIGHFNIEDLVYPDYSMKGTAGGAALYAAMGGYLWSRSISVISRIGSEYPQEYLNTLDELNIETHFTVIEGETMASVTEYRPGQDRKFMMKNVPAKLLELTPDLEDVMKSNIEEGSYVHLGPFNLDLLDSIVTYLKKKNCFVSIDTCDAFVLEDQDKMLDIIAKADLFMPSASELLSFKTKNRELNNIAKWISKQTGSLVIYKDSIRGSYVPVGDEYVNIPVYDMAKIKDLTGAGDSFCGAFLANYSLKKDIIECAVRANVTSSLAIEGCGALHYYQTSEEELNKRRTYILTKMEDISNG